MDDAKSLLLFGHPALRVGSSGRAVPLPQKAFVLAALLHHAPARRMTRAKLATLLYEEAGQAGALANLRKLLSRIQERQAALGIELVSVHRGDVQLAAGLPAVRCDLTAFDGVKILATESDIECLCDLYQGDFLDGVEGCGEALGCWIEARRARLRDRFCDLMQGGASRLGGARAEAVLRRVLEVDPCREGTWRDLIGLRAAEHGPAEGEAVFAEMRRRFEADLHTPVGQETLRFVGQLLRGASPASAVPALRPFTHVKVSSMSETRGRPTPAPVPAPVPKLCLLMPASLGARAEDLHLSQALVEDVTLALCRLRTIAVIAPHTAWQIPPGRSEAAGFEAHYLAETSVRSLGGRAQMAVKLIRRSDRIILWAEKYDLATRYLCDDHRQLCQSIATAIAGGIEEAELADGGGAAWQPDAYRLYLMGRRDLRSLRLPDVRRARKAFVRAREQSRDFVPAMNGIARALILEWLLLARTDRQSLREAHAIASQAVALDPFSGDARRELATATLFLGGLDAASEGFAQAVQLAPHHADILADYANALTHGSKVEAALQRIRQAIDLNPLPPDDYFWTAGGALFLMEDYDGALAELSRMKQPEPAYRLMAACLARAGRREEAAAYVAKTLKDHPNFRIGDWIATIPLRSEDHVAQYAGALREAGFS